MIKPDTLSKLNALNTWLKSVYGKAFWISEMLQKHGLSDEDINKIKQQFLDAYLEAVLRYINSVKEGHDGDRRHEIMFRYYGLNSGQNETLESIGTDLNLSRERIRQLRNKRMAFFRTKKKKAELESALVSIAKDFLNL